MADEEKKKEEEKKVAPKSDAAEEKKEEPKADASGEKLDKVLSGIDACMAGMDSLSKRMDSFEERMKEKKADSEEDPDEKDKPKEPVADARKDAEEEPKDAKKDAKKDAEEEPKADAIADIKAAIADMGKRLPKAFSDSDYHELADAQAKADSVFSGFGERAPRPLIGEDVMTYRRRVAGMLKIHSPAWKDVDIRAVADSTAFGVAEGMIYADATATARSPATVPADTLRAIVDTDTTGRRITSFVGSPKAWMGGFSAHRRRVSKINNGSRGVH